MPFMKQSGAEQAALVHWPARICRLGLAVLVYTVACAAQQADLSELSLRDLLNVRITTVGKRQQRLSESPAAVFISSPHAASAKEVREGLHGVSVLTTGESKDFAAQGGIIGFLVEDVRVRFEVNLQMAKQARLSISSKVLSLARRVIT